MCSYSLTTLFSGRFMTTTNAIGLSLGGEGNGGGSSSDIEAAPDGGDGAVATAAGAFAPRPTSPRPHLLLGCDHRSIWNISNTRIC